MTRPRIDLMVRAAARLTGIPIPVIRGQSRGAAIIHARMAVALVAWRQGHSLSRIAVGLGRSDHSTAHNLKTRAVTIPQVVTLAHRIERIVTGLDPMPPPPAGIAAPSDSDAAPEPRTMPTPQTVRVTHAGYINRNGEIVVGQLLGVEVDRA